MFGFYQYITKTAHAWENGLGGTRIDSVLGQPNAYGEYLAVLICVLIVCFFYKKLNYNKWVLIMFSLAVTVSFVLSLNRGSWIALFTGALFATVWYKRHVKPFLIIAGIAVLILITSPILIERFIELTQKTEFGSKNTLLSRVNYWDNMFNLLMERPFLGYGLGTAGTTSLVNYVPHNDYLRLAFETGIPTAFLYIMFLFKEFLDHIRRVKTKIFGIIHYSVFVLLVYFIVLSFFQNIVYNQVVFPMVLGLFAMSARLHDLERSGMIEAGT
jgi:O-antigen ligase